MKWLPPDIRNRATQLRKDGFSWKKIAALLQSSQSTIRYNIDAAYREAKQAENANVKNHNDKFDYREMLPTEDGVERNPEYDPRRDGYPIWKNPAAMLLGEPPIGRSALDKN